jgi:hypothetical protein
MYDPRTALVSRWALRHQGRDHLRRHVPRHLRPRQYDDWRGGPRIRILALPFLLSLDGVAPVDSVLFFLGGLCGAGVSREGVDGFGPGEHASFEIVETLWYG